MRHGHLDYFQNPPLGGRPNAKQGDHGTPKARNHLFITFYHVWGPTWLEIHWNSIWLRDWSHMTSHYTWGSVAPLHDFGGALGRPLDTFFWALTISWSQLSVSCVKWPLSHLYCFAISICSYVGSSLKVFHWSTQTTHNIRLKNGTTVNYIVSWKLHWWSPIKFHRAWRPAC